MVRFASAGPPPQNPQSTQPPQSRFRMPSLFNTIRAALYGVILLFTVICLAMAGHFQTVLAASDLTRFVPFAIFVCTASLFIFIVLLAFSFLLRERNPISTRIELASLGLAGVFWLVLGIYLTTSDSQDADVECYAPENPQLVMDPEVASFQTSQYQAMYRVLNAFSLMNAALIILACFILLFLALRRHRMGDVHMWHGPVTVCAWFNTYSNAKPGHKVKTSDSSILPFATAGAGAGAAAAAAPTESKRRSRSRTSPYQSAPPRRHTSEKRTAAPPPPPPKKPERHISGRSGKSASTTAGRSVMSEIDNGLMFHPKDRR